MSPLPSIVAVVLGIFLAYCYIIVPDQSPAIFENSNLAAWISKGRYLNADGYAIWFRDSLGDQEEEATADSLRTVSGRPLVLLLHGFPSFSYDFAEMYAALAEEGRYHVVTLDYLGFGLSDKPSGANYTLVLQADIIERLITQVCAARRRATGNDTGATEPVHVVAHDIGASIAQELLARQEPGAAGSENDRPVRTVRWRSFPPVTYSIASVVLFNGGLFPETHVPLLTQKLLISPISGPILQCLSNQKLFSASLAKVFGANQPSPELLLLYWGMLRYKGGNLIMHRLAQYMPERAARRERWVGALQAQAGRGVPVRLVNGPADPISGLHMVQRYHELVPEPDVHVLNADVGHYPQVEDHEHVMPLVSAFLRQHA
jgi:pimeloyl-ACP methyl ester carboxylesterase